MSRVPGVCVVVLMASLSGCGSDNDFSDLDAYMKEVRSRPAGNVEPTPKFHAYETFIYRAAALRSPFQPPVKIDLSGRQKGEHDVHPDPNRPKQFLEGFNIELFEMVGTLSDASGTFALLRGAGGVHRLKVGDYLGRNDGRIVAISEAQVDVLELVPDGSGGWLERPRTIPLKEHS